MRASWLEPQTGPLRGDVIIHQRGRPDAAAIYQLSRLGRRGQLPYRTYIEAMHHADRQAVMMGVDVWYTNDGAVFHRVAEHRRQA